MTAADHLKMATAAHTRYRRASNAQDLPTCRAEIQTALDHRRAAEEIDPALSESDVSHGPLVVFYLDYIARYDERHA